MCKISSKIDGREYSVGLNHVSFPYNLRNMKCQCEIQHLQNVCGVEVAD